MDTENKNNKLLLRYIKQVRQFINKAINNYFKGEHNKHVRYISWVGIAVFIIFVGMYQSGIKAPRYFPSATLIEIHEGATLTEISALMKEESAIKSVFMFESLVRIFGGNKGALYGQYYFDIPENAIGLALRITQGRYGLDPIRITIPEGATIEEISEVLDWKLPSFPKDKFTGLAYKLGMEGYLFPDTYLFLPNVKPEQAIEEMFNNFERKWATVEGMLDGKDISMEDVIIMASIIEKEAIEFEDKELVSGILWKRISIGMPLQVDAPFIYGVGKNTFELTTEDLRADSPYNTYTNKGLTPTPIANPGLDSIIATIEPKESPYLFYLSDLKSNMHYARDFEGHKRNKRLYLN